MGGRDTCVEDGSITMGLCVRQKIREDEFSNPIALDTLNNKKES